MQLDFIGFDQVLYDNGNVAIGWSVSAQGNQAIAIGAGSDTSRAATAVPSTTLNGTTYYFAGGATTLAGDQVSIGRVGYERQIKNVAAGEISTTSTDAVNGSQLYALTQAVEREISFNGDVAYQDTAVTKSLGETLTIDGGAAESSLRDNIGVVANGTDTLSIQLAKDITVDSVKADTVTSTTVNAGTVTSDTVQMNADANGNTTTITGGGVTITPTSGNAVSLTSTGLNNGNNVISGVAPGAISPNSTEAVNGSQLYSVAAGVAKLDNKIDQTGAMSAALAG